MMTSIETVIEDTEKWFFVNTPSPTVFILAYGGTSFKGWRFVMMLTEKEFVMQDINYWKDAVMKSLSSAIAMKIYRVKP